jgi:hypothetical protein
LAAGDLWNRQSISRSASLRRESMAVCMSRVTDGFGPFRLNRSIRVTLYRSSVLMA